MHHGFFYYIQNLAHLLRSRQAVSPSVLFSTLRRWVQSTAAPPQPRGNRHKTLHTAHSKIAGPAPKIDEVDRRGAAISIHPRIVGQKRPSLRLSRSLFLLTLTSMFSGSEEHAFPTQSTHGLSGRIVLHVDAGMCVCMHGWNLLGFLRRRGQSATMLLTCTQQQDHPSRAGMSERH